LIFLRLSFRDPAGATNEATRLSFIAEKARSSRNDTIDAYKSYAGNTAKATSLVGAPSWT